MQANIWRFIAIVAIALFFASNLTIASAAPDEDLLALARKHFDNSSTSSKQEHDVFDAFFRNVQKETGINLAPTDQDPAKQDAHNANQWGEDRTVKAEWIVWLCKDPDASAKVPSSGIAIAGAKIVGRVDLSWVKMQFPIRTFRCAFTDPIILDWASLRGLKLENSYIGRVTEKALSGDGLSVDGDLDFSDSDAQNPVSFRNAKIGGSFHAQAAHFDRGPLVVRPEPTIPPAALDLSTAKVGAGVNLEDAESNGAVTLSDATIEGDLDCMGAHIDGFAGHGDQADSALFAWSVKVTHDVLLCGHYNRSGYSDFEAHGTVVLGNATIGGDLKC